jgi:hypothetical protein
VIPNRPETPVYQENGPKWFTGEVTYRVFVIRMCAKLEKFMSENQWLSKK